MKIEYLRKSLRSVILIINSINPRELRSNVMAIQRATFDQDPVIPAKAGIQDYRGFYWIPALRFAAAGMTKLIAGLISTLISFQRSFQHPEYSNFQGGLIRNKIDRIPQIFILQSSIFNSHG